MKAALIIVAALVGLMALLLAVLAAQSRSLAPPERSGGRLPPCPDTPNCVGSEYPDAAAHYIAPLALPADLPVQAVRARLEQAIRALGGRVHTCAGDYVAATFESRLFGFVDDLQLRLEPQQSRIHVRAAARVGRSDLGMNRRRVEALRRHWRQLLAQDAAASR